MFCGHCGKTIGDGLKFCPFCGKEQAAPEPVTSSLNLSKPGPVSPPPPIPIPGLCPNCGYQNSDLTRHTCKKCHAALPFVGERDRQFAKTAAAMAPPAPKKPMGLGKALGIGCLGLVGLFIVLGVIGSLIGGSKPPTTVTPAITTANATPGAQTIAATAKPGPTAKPEPTPLPGVGATVTSGNWSYQVTKVERAKTVPGLFNTTETAKGEWVIVYMTIKNVGTRNFPINTTDFKIRGDNGIEISTATNSSSVAAGKKLTSLGEDIPPGVAFDTVAVYDVAPGSQNWRLYLAQPKQEITLS